MLNLVKSLLWRSPELVLFFGAWCACLFWVVLRVAIGDIVINGETWMLLTAFLVISGVFMLLCYLCRTPAVLDRIHVNNAAYGILLIVMMFGFVARYISGHTVGVFSLSEARSLHQSYGIQGGIPYYLSIALCPLIYPAVYIFVMAFNSSRQKLLIAGVIVLCLLLDVFTTGGRALFFSVSLFGMLVALLGRRDLYYNNMKRLFISVTFVMIAMFSLILGFAWVRAGGLDSYGMIDRYKESEEFLRGFGIAKPNMLLTYSTTQFIEYMGNPLYFFDYFLQVHHGAPKYGLYQFNLIANRVGFDQMTYKKEIDMLYADLGIQWNVWGTALRDMVIDFGRWGFQVVIILLGGLLYILRKNLRLGVHWQFAYVLILQWFIYSPFGSQFMLVFFQTIMLISGFALVAGSLMGGVPMVKIVRSIRMEKVSS